MDGDIFDITLIYKKRGWKLILLHYEGDVVGKEHGTIYSNTLFPGRKKIQTPYTCHDYDCGTWCSWRICR